MNDADTAPSSAAFTVSNINPRPFLLELVGQRISAQLKWNMEYQGILVSVDSYMNLQVIITCPYYALFFSFHKLKNIIKEIWLDF